MKLVDFSTRLIGFLLILAGIMLFNGPVLAVDDGARAYWKGRAGTNAVSIQYLRWDIDASGSKEFAPGNYIYANSNIEANIVVGSYFRHFTLFGRPSIFGANFIGGDVDVDVNTSIVASQFLPPGIAKGSTLSQSSVGFADPSVQLDVNLFGTPKLISGPDLLKYEPTWTVDANVVLAFPIGTYDDDKLVNLGLNRWWGRLGLPIKYHFGVFDPGHMSSIELVPSVWLFAKNDDFLGQDLENDPLYQLEGHLTHDFTTDFFGSLDVVYRHGFQTKINGVDVGDEHDSGRVGATLNFNITDNVIMRASYSTIAFGNTEIDDSLVRLQFVYAWHPLVENFKKLLK